MLKTIRIDIVSDIVCPWCVIGYKRLCKALDLVQPDISADIYWHPFELNPTMPIQGQNLREHLAEKYGTTPKASEMARATLTQLGKDVGFDFHFTDSMRIYNTRQAHQLLLWHKAKTNSLPCKRLCLTLTLRKIKILRSLITCSISPQYWIRALNRRDRHSRQRLGASRSENRTAVA